MSPSRYKNISYVKREDIRLINNGKNYQNPDFKYGTTFVIEFRNLDTCHQGNRVLRIDAICDIQKKKNLDLEEFLYKHVI